MLRWVLPTRLVVLEFAREDMNDKTRISQYGSSAPSNEDQPLHSEVDLEAPFDGTRLVQDSEKIGSANGNRTRILALKGLRANRCTIAPPGGNYSLKLYGKRAVYATRAIES
jgi:hypothetical protein